MEEAMASRYYCHMCLQMVDPIMEMEIKCPVCRSGFVEEMSSGTQETEEPDLDFSSDGALSLWASILLGMMGNPRRRRRFRRMEFEEDDDDNDDGERESELNREFESFMRRRRRSSATILQLLQGIRAGIPSETENSEGDRTRDGDGDRDRERERERVIFINPLNSTIIVQGSYDSRNSQNQNHTPIGSLGDYFIGPGLDLLLQHLAENDPNRYGSPPAQKEAIEALPTVTIKDIMQCSVCLDEFEKGTEAKEMPCKHKFHSGCILPWVELHRSCPVCWFQLPAEESKTDSERYRNTSRRESDGDNTNNRNHNNNDDINTTTTTSSTNDDGSGIEAGGGEGRNGHGNGRRFAFPWPFNSLFPSSSGSQSGGGSNSSSSSSSSSSTGNTSRTDET